MSICMSNMTYKCHIYYVSLLFNISSRSPVIHGDKVKNLSSISHFHFSVSSRMNFPTPAKVIFLILLVFHSIIDTMGLVTLPSQQKTYNLSIYLHGSYSSFNMPQKSYFLHEAFQFLSLLFLLYYKKSYFSVYFESLIYFNFIEERYCVLLIFILLQRKAFVGLLIFFFIFPLLPSSNNAC